VRCASFGYSIGSGTQEVRIALDGKVSQFAFPPGTY